ncbi:hypothetical protein [Mycobacterium lepromatosis]|nr:hypothetical protein [Mycobacterium lepromatosis]
MPDIEKGTEVRRVVTVKKISGNWPRSTGANKLEASQIEQGA